MGMLLEGGDVLKGTHVYLCTMSSRYCTAAAAAAAGQAIW